MIKRITKIALCLTLAFQSHVYAQQDSNKVDTPIESVVVERTPQLQLQPGKSISGFGQETLDAGIQRFTSPEELVPLTKDHPFIALGVTWDAQVGSDHQIEIEIRSSKNAREWTTWMAIEVDHHVELPNGSFAGPLVFMEAGTQYIQYRATLKPHITFRNPELKTIRLNFINPGVTDEVELKEHVATVPKSLKVRDRVGKITPESVDVVQKDNSDLDFVVNYDLPQYVARTQWGASLGLTNTASRSVTSVSHLIVHHSAGNYVPTADFAAVVRSYYNYHTGATLGWSDIGYNWLVDRNGVIYQGRAFNFDGNRDVIGAHFAGKNSRTMGICVIGTYTSTMPTESALERLRTMLAWKANERGIDVKNRSIHTAGNIFNISGHRDGGATECPGQQLYNYLPTLRARTFAFLNPPNLQIDSESFAIDQTSVAFELGIDNFENDVIAYIEYGTEEDNLDIESDDFEIDAQEGVSLITMNLTELAPATLYHYRVVAVNSDTFAVTEKSSFETASPTSLENDPETATEFILEQNYPNPFNPSTRITFEIPEASAVRVLIYNSQGQLMAVPADRNFSAGRHHVSFDASGVASGVLVYALEIDGVIVNTRKMLLLR